MRRTAICKVLFVFYGVSLFFVLNEPALFDMVTAILLLAFSKNIVFLIKKPVFFFYGAALIFSLFMELIFFETCRWSLISLYLFALMLLFCFLERDGYPVEYFVYGAGISAGYLLLYWLISPDVVTKFEDRLTGFFKDPNVLGATALALTFWSLHYTRKLYPLFFVSLILSLSRASILSFLVSILIVAAKKKFILLLAVLLLPLLFPEEIKIVVDGIFGAFGRGGLINSYDSDRLNNWFFILNHWGSSPFPLGPTWSDRNEFSAHSTYIRVLSEQGVFSLLALLVLIIKSLQNAWGAKWIFAALVSICINGAVIDATHWRIFFILIGVAYAQKLNSNYMFNK